MDTARSSATDRHRRGPVIEQIGPLSVYGKRAEASTPCAVRTWTTDPEWIRGGSVVKQSVVRGWHRPETVSITISAPRLSTALEPMDSPSTTKVTRFPSSRLMAPTLMEKAVRLALDT